MALIVLLHVIAAAVGILSLLYAAVGPNINARPLALAFALVLLICDMASFIHFLEALKG